jgi:hypothetical protein
MRWARCAARMGEMQNEGYIILVEKPEGEMPHGRPGHRWKGNIKILKK